jgi:ectoine hydroxylase-related dioxygenase (phytanoyl-CoA dioxygenase family)
MSFDDTLAALGVSDTSLSNDEKALLDRQGFLVLPNVMNDTWRVSLQARFDDLIAKEGTAAGHEVHTEAGTKRLSDLVNKGDIFDPIWTYPKLLACVHHILGRPFKLSSLNARDPLQGAGQQDLHADWGRRAAGEPFHVVNSMWLVDAFDGDNGCTRVVPGTHLADKTAAEMLADPKAPHPEEIVLTAPAGSVVVINAHVWHGGTVNLTGAQRRVVHCYFTAKEHPQQQDQAEYIRKRTWDRLSPAAREILDV